jgi:hypothetical protein
VTFKELVQLDLKILENDKINLKRTIRKKMLIKPLHKDEGGEIIDILTKSLKSGENYGSDTFLLMEPLV